MNLIYLCISLPNYHRKVTVDKPMEASEDCKIVFSGQNITLKTSVTHVHKSRIYSGDVEICSNQFLLCSHKMECLSYNGMVVEISILVRSK